MRSSHLVTAAIAAVLLATMSSRAGAAIPTCDLHKGMKIWFLDYAQDDYSMLHPLGVLEGTVDINESKWHAKCSGDGPGAKVYVPFNYVRNGKSEWDTRWPQDVYRTKAEADRALKSLRS